MSERKNTEEQIKNTRRLMTIYAAVPEKERTTSLALFSAFMDGIMAQRLADEREVEK